MIIGFITRALLRLGAALAVTLLIAALLPAPASAAMSNASLNNQKMFEFMNQERAARGLPALSRDSRLDSLAQSWANKMVAERKMYHPGTPQAMASAGYRSGAQNLAWYSPALDGAWAHDFWMNSSVHRKNILDPAFTHTGLAIACSTTGGPQPYVEVVVEFGGNAAPLKSAPPASPQVASKSPLPGATCGGNADPAPAPAPPPATQPPPAPAPAAAPPAAATVSPASKPPPSPSAPARSQASPTVAPKPKPEISPKAVTAVAQPPPDAPAAAATPADAPAAAATPAEPVDSSTAAEERAELNAELAAASAEGSQDRSGPLIALIAGSAGLFLMRRMNMRSRRTAPRHAAPRHLRP